MSFDETTTDEATSNVDNKAPMISAAMSNVSQSYLLTPENNIRLTKINRRLEMFLSLSVFFSGFLVLSIEKNWWGGYLSWSEVPTNEAQSYSDMMLSLYHFKNKWSKAG